MRTLAASATVAGVTVGALVAVNAVGDVIDPATGQVIAGARTQNGQDLLNTQQALLSAEPSQRPLPGTNTTIGVVATNASLSKAQAKRLAMSAHDGLARCIRPAHTPLDGDTLFVMATGSESGTADLLLLTVMAAEATIAGHEVIRLSLQDQQRFAGLPRRRGRAVVATRIGRFDNRYPSGGPGTQAGGRYGR